MSKYEPVIGLEVHVQLATKSKLFCSCSTKFGAPPNSNVCEICSGMPGALPTPNREAIELAVLAGIATNCKINFTSVFSRKNYFYPDLPAGYQISQFELPLCEHGFIKIKICGENKNIGITRIHLENDAGKNIHSTDKNISCVDLNRAGTPLIEIVSEPDIRSPEEACAYLKSLHELVTYLCLSDGNMEEGNFRCDANISLKPNGSKIFGTRTELKNLNSFRNVQKALEYEILRQEDLLENGDEVAQQTRLYNPDKNITVAMRGKEEAQDYRYFPDPDLLPITISHESYEILKRELPELPESRKARFIEMTGLPDAEVEILLHNFRLADYFEAASAECNPHKAASFILGPIIKVCNTKNIPPDPLNWKMTAQNLAQIIKLVESGKINVKMANDIVENLLFSALDVEQYIEEKGLGQISDTSALEQIVQEIIHKFPKECEEYKKGKKKLLSFFMGQIMRQTKGKANPTLVTEIINKILL